VLRTLVPVALASAAILTACGGGGGSSDKTPTATTGAKATAAASPSASAKTAASGSTPGATSAASGSTPSTSGGATSAPVGAATAPVSVPTTPAGTTGGPTADAASAPALINAAMVLPADLPAGWTIASDTTQDNAAAAAADPSTAASNTRCGRLLGRTLVTQPSDIVTAYLAGQTVSFFSQATVYATTAGAIDCANEAAGKLAQPGQLARAFGTLFTDPDSVVVTPVDFKQVADGSFAGTLAGQTNANGVVVDIVVLVVAFREGNMSMVVGSVANTAPTTTELEPLVNLVVQRVAAAQQ
jgi:hypothetical protein